ncbi:MAG: hypothetical protein NZ898_16895, partial [Myxococcota bacterium]|nr:hypothetical protein [Myxococcota bacterium]
MRGAAGLLVLAMLAGGCGGARGRGEGSASRTAAHERSRSLGGTSGAAQRDDAGRCDARQPGREEAEYDINGDETPDVRKVFA